MACGGLPRSRRPAPQRAFFFCAREAVDGFCAQGVNQEFGARLGAAVKNKTRKQKRVARRKNPLAHMNVGSSHLPEHTGWCVHTGV